MSNSPTCAVMWFRRDLRVHDLPALVAAAGAEQMFGLYVLDERLLTSDAMSPARVAYLSEALDDLSTALADRGSRLVVRRGDPAEEVVDVATTVGADIVHLTRDHTPFATERDQAVAEALQDADIDVEAHDGVTIHPPGTVLTNSGTAYKVFTPFSRSWYDRDRPEPEDAPSSLPSAPGDTPDGLSVGDVDLLDVTRDDAWPRGGESAARDRLDAWLDGGVDDYDDARDLLAQDATSRLSADLHFGCLSAREVHSRLDRRYSGQDAFARQLVWRDFYLHVLDAWPHAARQAFREEFADLPWRDDSEGFTAWKEGRTGYPIVDAGMRQLAESGWMHNRARMIVASFLTKDLLIDWRWGERHFLSHLVDADMANNNGGWQWAAGTGTDAQPFFRIFNPVTQGQRFDPDGAYVRRWVPELADVGDDAIHSPWEMDEETQREVGVVIGEDYPAPIVDHSEARQRALDFYDEHKGS